MQRLSTTLEYKILIALIESLSTNENIEDVIKRSHPAMDARRNDVALILLALFISKYQLVDKFRLHDALLETYLDFR